MDLWDIVDGSKEAPPFHIYVFGCVAYPMVSDIKNGKLDAKDTKYFIFGLL